MKKIFLSACVLAGMYAQAQNTFPASGNAGIGTTTPNASSLLEMVSTSKGLLIPRMTKNQRDAIASPATGLMIFQTNSTPGFYYYSGSNWEAVTPKAKGWNLTGNSGTMTATNFIGTTDAQPLVFKINGQISGILDGTGFGKDNTSFGYQSLSTNTTGSWNAAFGSQALASNTTAVFNTAAGFYALNKNTTGDRNTSAGSYSMYNNTTGRLNAAFGVDGLNANTTGSTNTAIGFEALRNNITGYSNTAVGSGALFSNTSRSNLVAIGDSALFNNGINPNYDAEWNTAVGSKSLFSNNDGFSNTALGFNTLYFNTTGNFNSAMGAFALQSNTSGKLNNAIGANALENNETGIGNTAIGDLALSGIISGSNNTAIGASADVNTFTTSNATALGSGAIATASNQVMLGSTSVTSVKAAGSFVIYSDGRFKKNIKNNVPGLDFINQLKPVTYQYDIHKLNDYIQPDERISSDKKRLQKREMSKDEKVQKIMEEAIAAKERKSYTGFVAQDVEKAAEKIGYEFSGVYKPQNEKDPYGLSYADFVVPLVKAVQELSKQNEDIKKEYDAKINAQQKEINDLKAMITGKQTTSVYNAPLEQNIPNPFNNTTTIAYILPQKYTKAIIIVTDQSGKNVKEIKLTGYGKGTVSIDADVLASGAYHYSLYVDGKIMGSKQMLLTK